MDASREKHSLLPKKSKKSSVVRGARHPGVRMHMPVLGFKRISFRSSRNGNTGCYCLLFKHENLGFSQSKRDGLMMAIMWHQDVLVWEHLGAKDNLVRR